MRRLLAVGIAFVLSSCGDAQPRPEDSAEATADPAADSIPAPAATPVTDTASKSPAPEPVQPIDPNIPQAIAGEDGWNYFLRAESDLDGDGQTERIVLTARVEMYRGRPAWDDGQPWQVYIEEPNGHRTYIYAQRLQLGALTMRITRGGDGQLPKVVLLENLPDRLRVFETAYEGPGRVLTAIQYERDLNGEGVFNGP